MNAKLIKILDVCKNALMIQNSMG